jgi:hypothetical protein
MAKLSAMPLLSSAKKTLTGGVGWPFAAMVKSRSSPIVGLMGLLGEREMTVTPERKAELIAALEELIGPKRMERPKVVTRDADVVRDAEPHVSRADPNYARSEGGVVRVRRSDFVRINISVGSSTARETGAAPTAEST